MVSPPTRLGCCKPCETRGLRGRFAPARKGARRCSGAGVLRSTPWVCTPWSTPAGYPEYSHGYSEYSHGYSEYPWEYSEYPWQYSEYRVGVLRVPVGVYPLEDPRLGRHASWQWRRCSGVLYEDDSIQFGVKSAFNGDGPAPLCCSGPAPLCCSGPAPLCCSGPAPLWCSGPGEGGERLALVEYWVLQGAIRTTGYHRVLNGACRALHARRRARDRERVRRQQGLRRPRRLHARHALPTRHTPRRTSPPRQGML
jgi:hypothetical protein